MNMLHYTNIWVPAAPAADGFQMPITPNLWRTCALCRAKDNIAYAHMPDLPKDRMVYVHAEEDWFTLSTWDLCQRCIYWVRVCTEWEWELRHETLPPTRAQIHEDELKISAIAFFHPPFYHISCPIEYRLIRFEEDLRAQRCQAYAKRNVGSRRDFGLGTLEERLYKFKLAKKRSHDLEEIISGYEKEREEIMSKLKALEEVELSFILQ